ncbi:hypothetical protein B0T19DRAFT_8297 [Cercophora scortea]|uniref:BZIP domain-containing protein n=1 Tax=Cercophora scortea TaxID=314031 RepID=A0AAE0J1Z9_9PEZI|nr:hypothetical protein B0T19DRAFT_8297 [Cercophora scortea]
MDSSCGLGDEGNWGLPPDYSVLETDVYADPFILGPLDIIPCHPPPGDQGFHDEYVEILAPPYSQVPIGSYFLQTETETGFLDGRTLGPGVAEAPVGLGLPSPWIISPMERIDGGWASTPCLWDPSGWAQPAYCNLVSPACSELPGVPQAQAQAQAQAHVSPAVQDFSVEPPLQTLPPAQSPKRTNAPAPAPPRPKTPVPATTSRTSRLRETHSNERRELRPRSPNSVVRSTKLATDPPKSEKVRTYKRDAGIKNRRKCSAQLKMYELKSKGLQEENLKLLEGRRALKEEMLALREEILAHAGCNDQIISDYIAYVARELVKEERKKYHALQGHKCRQ